MSLELAFGYASESGPKDRNEDFGGLVAPEGELMATRGAVAALADGVSGGVHGREAAEATVRNLFSDYYATPETWEIPQALERVLSAANRWLLSQSASKREPGGMATTVAALVLRGGRFVVAHAGDTRVYRLRARRLDRLTQDHVWERPDMHHVLKRAVGLDQHLALDFTEGAVEVGDVFLLATDGVWEPLSEARLHQLLALYRDPEFTARELVKEALSAGGRDNATALAVRVDRLPEETLASRLSDLAALPVPGRVHPGAEVDGLCIEACLHDSRETLLYRVRAPSGQLLVLKTLAPAVADDPELRARLAAEEWIARRVQSHYFPQAVNLGTKNFLYFLATWHEGETLAARLARGHRFTPVEVAGLGIRLVKGLAALHRLGIVHRDIKPENLHLGNDERLRILDLGVASCPALGLGRDAPAAGTPSYLAPEIFDGADATTQSDLYSAGVTLYHLLTGRYPYGEVEPFQHPKFGEPVPVTRTRPDVPGWLENAILKAVARDPKRRFETAEEMQLALERAEAAGLAPPRRTPLLERDPAVRWQFIAAISLTLNLLLIFLLVAS